MTRKTMGRVFRLLLCALLCVAMAVPLTGTAMAFDGSNEEQDITIRITPPQSLTGDVAAVEVCITDNAGAGFQSAQVKSGNGSWHDVTSQLTRTENRWCCVEDVTENCAVQVRVTRPDGMLYEKSQYIQCFSTTDNRVLSTAGGGTTTAQPSESLSTTPLTPPGGQGTVIDNVSGTSEESGREFFTIATPSENVFYLVIDRKKDSENVYFLNAVTESDLMALAEKDTDAPSQSAVPDPTPVCVCKEKCIPGEVNANCPVCVLSYQICTGTAPAPSQTTPEPEQPKSGGGTGTIIIVLVAAVAVGGAGWYLKIYKPKHDLDNAEDFDDLTGGEEPMVNEDDLPAAYQDEPDYPDGYGDEP